MNAPVFVRMHKLELALLLIEHRHWRNGHLEEFAAKAFAGTLDRSLIDLDDRKLKEFLERHGFDLAGLV